MLKKIKSLFIVEEEVSGKSVKKESTEEKQKLDISIDPETGSVTKASLDRFLKVLAEAMESNNMEGYDYLEYKQALRSLDKLEQDEEKRYLTSYTLAKTMGAEKDVLVKSANFYLNVLKTEESKFNDSVKKQVESRLHARTKSLSNLKERKLKKEEQIKILQEEIKTIEKKIEAVQKEIDTSSNKVASVQKSFHAAYELIVNQIRDDLEKIEKYIK